MVYLNFVKPDSFFVPHILLVIPDHVYLQKLLH